MQNRLPDLSRVRAPSPARFWARLCYRAAQPGDWWNPLESVSLSADGGDGARLLPALEKLGRLLRAARESIFGLGGVWQLSTQHLSRQPYPLHYSEWTAEPPAPDDAHEDGRARAERAVRAARVAEEAFPLADILERAAALGAREGVQLWWDPPQRQAGEGLDFCDTSALRVSGLD